MPKDCHGRTAEEITELLVKRAESEQTRISQPLTGDEIRQYTAETIAMLKSSLAPSSHDWKLHFPGRLILKAFCSNKHANFDFGRFKIAYMRASEESSQNPFAEIEAIFREFATL